MPRGAPAFRLLAHYIELLREDSAAATPELQRLAVAHVCDLLALTLGPARDALELANRRGARAARLLRIKRDVIKNVSGEISIEAIAARERVSIRHVQRLFEEDGTTFTEFLRG